MTARLPGKCRRCGARVEARLQGEAEERGWTEGNHVHDQRDLPAGWCDPGSWDDHVCEAAS